MEEMKHTPGPWVIDNGATRFDIFSGDAATLVAVVDRSLLSSNLDQTARANARLIAAAPELLEALRAMLDTAYNDITPECDKARAAIAKATGQSK